MRASIVTLVAAVVLGLVAAVGVFIYTANAEERVIADQQPVSVYVTTDVIAAGTPFATALAEGVIEQTRMPAAVTPSSALRDAVTGVALTDIQPGQIVMAASFGTEVPALEPITLDAGQMAVSLELGDPQRVGSFLRPGSRIAVFNTVEDPERQTRLLLSDITVLAVGSATANESTTDQEEAALTALVTVAVDPNQAERLIHAAQTGSLYLALLTSDSVTVTTAGVSDTTLYEQEQQ